MANFNYIFIFLILCIVLMLIDIVFLAVSIYKYIVIDANSRGIKEYKFWGIIASAGNNQPGIILYLIKRKKYPVKNLSEIEKKEMYKKKKNIIGGFICLFLVGTFVLIGIVLS